MRRCRLISVRVGAGVAALLAGACRRPAQSDTGSLKPAEKREVAVRVAPSTASEVRTTTEQRLERILALGDIADAAERKRALAAAWAEASDEERALLLEALWALGEARGAQARFAELFAIWCESDPAAAFAAAGKVAKGLPTFLGLLRGWTERDPMAALRWSMAPGHDDYNWIQSMADFVEDKGAFVRAVHAAGLNWSEIAYGDPLPVYVAAWHKENPAAALAWLDSLPKSEGTTALIVGAARSHWWSLDGRHIPSLVDLIERLPADAEGAGRLAGLVREWGRGDPEAALRWANAHGTSHPAATEAAIIGALGGVAALDSEAAKGYLSQLTSADLRRQGERELAAGWAITDAKAAVAWLNQRQADWLGEVWGEAGEHKLRFMAAWLEVEPETFIRRASHLPDQEGAEVMLANAAAAIGHPKPIGLGNPERALELLTMLPDSQARRGSLATLATNWLMSRERAQAEAAIRATSLSDDEKTRLLELGGVKP